MKIAILSDSHDNVKNTEIAVNSAMALNAEVLFFCGDFCSSGVGGFLAKFKGPIYVVFGNNDADRVRIVDKMKSLNNQVKFFYDGDGEFELDGKRIAINHYPLYAIALARTGDYDLVAFGHDHTPRIEKHGNCLAINPGSVERNNDDVALSFAIYDTTTHTAQLHKLDGSILTI